MAFRRRGAPFTFDSHGFLDLLRKLKKLPVTNKEQPEQSLLAPSFDHAVKDPVENSIAVSSRNQVVIIEGNYTLLNEDPWSQIADLVDDRRVISSAPLCYRIVSDLCRWFVDAPPSIALERLSERHLQAGIETSREAAIARTLENDIPNGEMIRSSLIEPTIRVVN